MANSSALVAAAMYGYEEVVYFLVDLGVNVDLQVGEYCKNALVGATASKCDSVAKRPTYLKS